MRQYLLLREQDVAALSSQLKKARDQIRQFEEQLAQEQARVSEIEQMNRTLERRVAENDRERAVALEGLQAELTELRFQVKSKNDKVKVLEYQSQAAVQEVESIKERVRMDLRKIRTREKELESRLEIMKKDSEALIGARETRVIELKRKVDLLEFNMDLVQSQLEEERKNSAQLRERLEKAAQVVRVAGGLLDQKGANALAEAMLEPGVDQRKAS
jgi:chromosome segregation ATPase